PDGNRLFNSRQALIRGVPPTPVLAGSNTTIGVIATDALLTKVQARKLAQLGHDGLARSINPAHGMSDGDTIFALGTGRAGLMPGMTLLGTLAAEVTARAVVRAVQAAVGLTIETAQWPAMRDLRPKS
ncbi:MAG: P1 family peptidase, partial [Burkholderiaceae bacterium]